MITKEFQVDIIKYEDNEDRGEEEVVLSGRIIEWLLNKIEKFNESQSGENEEVESYVKTYWPCVAGSSIAFVTLLSHLIS